MNAAKYLFALWGGVLIYASLSVLFGARGISAHQQLEGEQQKQEANLENLKYINQDLENTMNSLLYDRDTLTVYAREQGYASGEERFIRIVGLGLSQKHRTSPGAVLVAAEPQYTPDRSLRIIALAVGLSMFACMALSDFLKYLRVREDPADQAVTGPVTRPVKSASMKVSP